MAIRILGFSSLASRTHPRTCQAKHMSFWGQVSVKASWKLCTQMIQSIPKSSYMCFIVFRFTKDCLISVCLEDEGVKAMIKKLDKDQWHHMKKNEKESSSWGFSVLFYLEDFGCSEVLNWFGHPVKTCNTWCGLPVAFLESQARSNGIKAPFSYVRTSENQ